MKRILSVALVVLMIGACLAMSVSADSYNYGGTWDYQFELKKADPANVVKDGKIGDGEYERLDVVTDPDEEGNMFWVAYTDSTMYDYGEEMLKTMEYYFSWDETHGFNLAVRFKPHELKQVLVEGSNKDKPMDYFLQNTGFQLELASKESRSQSDFEGVLYYAIARRTDNGQYLEGHWCQFGILGSYDPVAGQDYVIEYDFNTGYAVCEWSIPISQVIAGNIGAGTNIYFSLAVTGGTQDAIDPAQDTDPTDMYAVGLGDYCYLCKRSKDSTHITATLSDEIIPGGGNTDGGNTDGGNGSGNNGSGNNGSGSGNNGGYNGGTVDPVNGDNGGNNGGNGGSGSVNTGDAILVLAAVSAVSAAGAFISKKRRG